MPKNENNREEIIEIMEELQKYVPKDCEGTCMHYVYQQLFNVFVQMVKD